MLTCERLWKLLSGNRLLYLSAIGATAAGTTLSLTVPLVVKYAVDTVIGGQPSPYAFITMGLAGCALAIVLLTCLQGLFTYLRGKWSVVASERIAKDLKDKMYDHLQRLPYDYHVKAQTGDLLQRCTSDVDTIRRFLATQVIELGRILFMVFFSIGFMLSLHVGLTMSALVMMPVIIAFSARFSVKIGAAFLKADEKEGQLSTVLNENLSGVRVVRAFGREQYETGKFEERSSEYRELVYQMIKKMAIFWSLSDALCFIQIGAVLFYGIHLVYTQAITLGTLMVFTTYVSMLIWPIRGLGRILGDMSKMGVSLGRVLEVLNTPAEADDDAVCPSPDLKGDIVFEDVHFAYDANTPVFDGLSFTVKQGETIGILGATGTGKSTIMHLLLRLYDYDQGRITINGVDLKHISKKWLRQHIGMVLQEPFLYSKTILENAKMAKNHVTDEEVFIAAKTAAIHHVVEGFEQGYGTMVGERGVTLSGGQKQRLAIARTLIKTSDILIFDDSLSAVDTETDLHIRQALKNWRKDVTTFIISQRMTTLKDASRIFVIENGKLADTGTHEALISREGLYKRIWDIQSMEDDIT